ncbi:protein dpy-30 homolog [Hydractinia symbiolongicarpus]|uniref:protein dpy-30 homolog n=1 Tax=Hydractinia symbiolongicarpus TaxID=13093 RepID=UPI0025519B4E|nr:protein dpy-30 homolog [Hydractinia symbiolongicarpus]
MSSEEPMQVATAEEVQPTPEAAEVKDEPIATIEDTPVVSTPQTVNTLLVSTPPPSTTPVSTPALTENIKKIISEEKEAVNKPKAKSDVQSLPTRQYLDHSVVPILLQALTALSKERPADPIDFVAAYLMKNKHLYQQS